MAKEMSFDFDPLLDRGVILDEESQTTLIEHGYKTAVISQPNGIFIIEFDPEGIETFIEEIKSVPGWNQISMDGLYCSDESSLQRDSVMFTTHPVDENSLTLSQAWEKLKTNPDLARTTEFLKSK